MSYLKLTEYEYSVHNSYFFDSDDEPKFVCENALASVQIQIYAEAHGFNEISLSQIEVLFRMERLKLSLALQDINTATYRSELKLIMRSFYLRHNTDVFTDSAALDRFYLLLNNYYRERAKTDALTGRG